jgi:hypothetical protein
MAKQTFSTGQVLTSAQMTSLQANDYNQTVSAKTASYTLAAADAGTTITMNSATATTITVNTSLFTAGDTLRIANIGNGTCTVTAGTATVTTAGTLALVQWAGGMLYFTSAGASIFFPDAVAATATTIAIFNETQASGTNGGSSVQTTYTKRTLNTTVVNNIGATLTSSVIALVAGTYRVTAISPLFNCNAVAIRLRNTTDSTTTIAGVNNYALSPASVNCLLDGYFTITGTKNFEVQYYQAGAAVASNGLGVAISSAGVSEIYTTITIEKIG